MSFFFVRAHRERWDGLTATHVMCIQAAWDEVNEHILRAGVESKATTTTKKKKKKKMDIDIDIDIDGGGKENVTDDAVRGAVRAEDDDDEEEIL